MIAECGRVKTEHYETYLATSEALYQDWRKLDKMIDEQIRLARTGDNPGYNAAKEAVLVRRIKIVKTMMQNNVNWLKERIEELAAIENQVVEVLPNKPKRVIDADDRTEQPGRQSNILAARPRIFMSSERKATLSA